MSVSRIGSGQKIPRWGEFVFFGGEFVFLAVFTIAFCGISKGKKHAAGIYKYIVLN